MVVEPKDCLWWCIMVAEPKGNRPGDSTVPHHSQAVVAWYSPLPPFAFSRRGTGSNRKEPNPFKVIRSETEKKKPTRISHEHSAEPPQSLSPLPQQVASN